MTCEKGDQAMSETSPSEDMNDKQQEPSSDQEVKFIAGVIQRIDEVLFMISS